MFMALQGNHCHPWFNVSFTCQNLQCCVGLLVLQPLCETQPGIHGSSWLQCTTNAQGGVRPSCVAGTPTALQSCRESAPMGAKGLATCTKEEAEVMRLAEDLRAEASLESILESLELLCNSLNDPKEKDTVAGIFLQAGGLPILIHHLRSTSLSNCNSSPDSIQSVVAEKAALALTVLVNSEHDILLPALEVVTGIMMPLMDILRAGGSLQNRCLAVDVLLELAVSQAKAGSEMADAGVMGLLLSLYLEIQELPDAKALSLPLATLAVRLASFEPVAADDFEAAIRVPDTVQAFAAMTILQVCPTCLFLGSLLG
jgi:hypothetical protein